MWTQKLKNGKVSFRENWKNPLTGKWQQVSVRYAKDTRRTRKEAQLILDEKIRKKLDGVQNNNTDIIFHDLKNKYLKLAKKQLSPTSYKLYYSNLNRIDKDWGKGIIVKNITNQFLNKYFEGLLYNRGLSNGATKVCIHALSSCFNFGVKYGYINQNTVHNIKISFKNEAQEKNAEIQNKYLEDSEFQKILKFCDKHKRKDVKDVVLWIYLTGMRFGEVAALQKKNIFKDADGHWYATVCGTLYYDSNLKKWIKSKNAKSAAGNREVLLSDEALQLAKAHCKNKKADEFIFKNRYNRVWQTTSLDVYLKKVQSETHIRKRLTTHIFRHTHVSKLADMGIPLYVIQRRVGHGSSRITEQIYLHVTKHAKNNLASKLESFTDSLRISGKK
ncbi:site-specific integrase [Lactobacillus sp. LL6]|uniref:tyrosine-type recombinase/integrase n=1 Tax=Lactobacillus sp. LL6 TaxID=2596827 RepID=UPI0011857F56|nr:site-specific integrase [Lactobacillus sp. LL6]TSO25327.1 site-specific integrase [Lactobacillus sp. LL6]